MPTDIGMVSFLRAALFIPGLVVLLVSAPTLVGNATASRTTGGGPSTTSAALDETGASSTVIERQDPQPPATQPRPPAAQPQPQPQPQPPAPQPEPEPEPERPGPSVEEPVAPDPPGPGEGRRVLHASFDSAPLGGLSKSELARQVGQLRGVNSSGLSRSRVEPDSSGDGRVLRVAFPAEEGGGAAWQAGLPEVYDHACISYRVRFSPGFEFSRGGKLPGLAGVAEGYSTQYASGGDTPGLTPPDRGPDGRNAWSARIMWREDGEATTYLYAPDYGGKYGQSEFWQRRFDDGRFHTVETCVTMNTPGERDGSIVTRFDGEPAYRQDGMRFRDTRKLGINVLYFSTFRGGHDASWYSDQDAYIEFDDFSVTVP